MDDLLKAIVTAYGSSAAAAVALRAATPGGLWLNQAPQTSSGTYIILVPLAMTVDHAMGAGAGHPAVSDGNIQFSVCDPVNMANAAAALAKLVALYEDNLLTLDSHTTLYARRANDGIPMRDPDGEGCSIAIEFRYMLGNK